MAILMSLEGEQSMFCNSVSLNVNPYSYTPPPIIDQSFSRVTCSWLPGYHSLIRYSTKTFDISYYASIN